MVLVSEIFAEVYLSFVISKRLFLFFNFFRDRLTWVFILVCVGHIGYIGLCWL